MAVKEKLAAAIVDHRRVVMGAVFLLTLVCALLIPRVEVNTDMSKYLADSSPMKQGTELLAEQLPGIQNPKTIRVMVDGLPNDATKAEALAYLQGIEGVDEVAYEPGSTDYNRDDHTLYVLSTSYDYASPEERAIEAAALEVADAVADVAPGATAVAKNDNPATSELPPVIIVVALVLLAIVLFVMGPSWAEPLLYLVAIGCAVGINLGTNVIQGSIAQVTFSIGAILQLVLSMDYSIILMNRFRQELAYEATRGVSSEKSLDAASVGDAAAACGAQAAGGDGDGAALLLASDAPEAAAARADAMRRALAGAFTSISASSLTTFAGLLTLVFMTFKIGGDLGVVLAKGVLISLVCVFTVLPGLILWAHRAIARTAKPTPTLRLGGLATFEHRARYGLLAGFVAVFACAYLLQGSTAVSYTLNYEDPVADVFPVTSQVVVLYSNDDEDAAAAIAGDLADDPRVRTVNAWSTTLGKPLTADELTEAFETMGGDAGGFDQSMVGQLFVLYGSKHPSEGETSLSIEELVRFLQEDVLTNKLYARMVDDDQKAAIDELAGTAEDARAQMVGPDFSIMALTTAYASGTEETATLMDDLAQACDARLAGDHYLIGDAAMVREMRQGFGAEMLTITLISAIAIFLVVAIAFRSLAIPAILVLVVQCGVYLTVLAIGLQGYHIYYLAMLIVQCILMGATIDYGILFTNLYREARRTLGIRDALASAYANSINTIMTSGLIMILVTAAIALTSPEPTIGQICQTISMGATSAVLLIMLFLPGILAALDRFTAGKGRAAG